MQYLEDFGKETYFEKHGYTWDSRIEAYLNKDEWKIFSKDYIDDHSFDTLMANFQEDSTPGHWKVYLNVESSADVRNIHKHYGVIKGLDV
jgi:hypothetical protein